MEGKGGQKSDPALRELPERLSQKFNSRLLLNIQAVTLIKVKAPRFFRKFTPINVNDFKSSKVRKSMVKMKIIVLSSHQITVMARFLTVHSPPTC